MFYNIKKFVLGLIFPQFCLGCQKEGQWLCDDCQQKNLPVQTQVCPECGRISDRGEYCLEHRRKKALKGIITSCYYEEGSIKEMIHNFKYNNILELGDFLGEMMAEALVAHLSIGEDILITAVPIHWLRRAQRGFNQAEILAKIVVKKLNENQPEAGRPLAENFKILKKIRRTKPQVQTDSKKRLKNVLKSFKFTKKISLRGRTIIIVDDVTTTGTTLNECARVLKKAGAKEVWGLVVARG